MKSLSCGVYPLDRHYCWIHHELNHRIARCRGTWYDHFCLKCKNILLWYVFYHLRYCCSSVYVLRGTSFIKRRVTIKSTTQETNKALHCFNFYLLIITCLIKLIKLSYICAIQYNTIQYTHVGVVSIDSQETWAIIIVVSDDLLVSLVVIVSIVS